MSQAIPSAPCTDFIRDIIDEHNRTGRFDQRVAPGFPRFLKFWRIHN